VTAFLAALVSRGAAPRQARLRLGKLDGFRTGVNPITRESLAIPRRRYAVVESVADRRAALQGLDDYNLQFSGMGPPDIPPLTLWMHDPQPHTPEGKVPSHGDDCTVVEFKEIYDFTIHLRLRGEVASTSELHDSVIERQAPGFGQPDKSHSRLGFFNHPCTNKVIEVPKAGCARFWIEFEFGKWLVPKIYNSLDLLEPSIVETARECFGLGFVQGCHWYE
jgi:hypothetical protein